jgi:hypothetical protein
MKMTAVIVGECDVKPSGDGETWLVQNTEGWGAIISDSDTHWVSPRDGMRTDGASSPRFLWPIVSPFGDGRRGNHLLAALVHDYLYQNHGYYDMGRRVPVTKQWADDAFLAMLTALGVSAWRRYAMYWAVKYSLDAQIAWNKHNDMDGVK